MIQITDSTDAREQREAEAALDAAEVADRRDHADRCIGGWLGEDPDGRPIACPRCRPHLLHTPCHLCGVRYEACALQSASRLGACCEHCNHSRRQTTGGAA